MHGTLCHVQGKHLLVNGCCAGAACTLLVAWEAWQAWLSQFAALQVKTPEEQEAEEEAERQRAEAARRAEEDASERLRWQLMEVCRLSHLVHSSPGFCLQAFHCSPAHVIGRNRTSCLEFSCAAGSRK